MTSGRALPVDDDEGPERFPINQAATATYSSRDDVHHLVARRLAAHGVRDVLDLGGGTGPLAVELTALDIRCVVVDEATRLGQAPRAAVPADPRHCRSATPR